MLLKLGNYSFATNDPELTTHHVHLPSPLGTKMIKEVTTHFRGVLLSTDGTQNTLNTQVQNLINALNTDNQDLIFLLNDGSTRSVHSINTRDTMRGIKITDISFPQGDRGEMGAFRSYEFTAKAEFIVGSRIGYWSFMESISVFGGGQKWVLMPALTGSPQKQILQQQTPYGAIQQGEATGILGYPPVPRPLWTDYYHSDQSSADKRTPQFQQNQNMQYPISWRFVFEAATNVFGNGSPTVITSNNLV